MCFSAPASFIAGSVLLAGGVVSVRKVQQPSQLMFASIPLLFGVQQITEGFVWLGITEPGWEAWRDPATYVFFIIAQVVWPLWVPWSVMRIEQHPVRKKILRGLTVAGAIVSVYIIYMVVNYRVNAVALEHHIRYDHAYPPWKIFLNGFFYVLVTIVPPFISSVRRTTLLGAIILSSFVVSALFFREYVISIWCFFAAVLSLVVLLIGYARYEPCKRKPAG